MTTANALQFTLNKITRIVIFLRVYIAIAILLIIVVCTSYGTYEQGVQDTHQEAYENGLMVKEILKEGEVIYRWIETHKLGYE
jgi:hypothetical protein